MNDKIITYLREHPDGTSSREIAETFLKFKSPLDSLAHTMVRAVLGQDKRCAAGDDGLWRALKITASGGEKRLIDTNWAAVSVLIHNRRLMHVSVWTVLPSPECKASVWIADPNVIGAEERDVLVSSTDTPFDPERKDETAAGLCSLLAETVPVYAVGYEEGLLAWHCAGATSVLTDDSLLLSHMFRAAGVASPRPLELETCAVTLLGRSPLALSAAGRGLLLAECASELINRCVQSGLETREALERSLERETESFDFTKKNFGPQTLTEIPPVPGVYGFKDSAGAFVYIGKATNLKRRVNGYFRRTEESPTKIEQLRNESVDLVTYPCGSELESLIYEHRLILKHSPRLNTQVEICERKGQYRPLDDCVVLLPHATETKGMAVCFRRGQRVQLRPFERSFTDSEGLATELQEFFYSARLTPTSVDFPEQEIAERWLRRYLDELPVVQSSRAATGEELVAMIRMAWSEANG